MMNPGMSAKRDSIGDVVRRALLHSETESDRPDSVFQFRFAAEEAVFAGHFPGFPILPGVFQIEMTRLAAGISRGAPCRIERVDRCKFIRMIRSGETLELRLKMVGDDPTLRVHAVISVAGEKAGEVRLTLAEDAARA